MANHSDVEVVEKPALERLLVIRQVTKWDVEKLLMND